MQTEAQYLTELEVQSLLNDFKLADWIRIEDFSRLLCSNLIGWSANDLMNEAIVRLLDGRRRWPADIHPRTVLNWTMRGIANNVRKSAKNSPIDHSVEVLDDIPDSDYIRLSVTPAAFATPQKIVQDRQMIAKIAKICEGDETLQALLELWADGFLGLEGEKAPYWGRASFEAAKRRFRRKLAACAADWRQT